MTRKFLDHKSIALLEPTTTRTVSCSRRLTLGKICWKQNAVRKLKNYSSPCPWQTSHLFLHFLLSLTRGWQTYPSQHPPPGGFQLLGTKCHRHRNRKKNGKGWECPSSWQDLEENYTQIAPIQPSRDQILSTSWNWAWLRTQFCTLCVWVWYQHMSVHTCRARESWITMKSKCLKF